MKATRDDERERSHVRPSPSIISVVGVTAFKVSPSLAAASILPVMSRSLPSLPPWLLAPVQLGSVKIG